MFKDYNKYLKESLKIYTFLLVIIFIMKIVGLNCFGLDVNNHVMIKINKIVWYFKIREIWYIFTLWLYAYFMISIVSNNKNVRLNALIITAIDVLLILTIKNYMGKYLIAFCDSVLLYTGCLIANKGKIKKTTKRAIIVFLINMLFQFISMITRIGKFEIVQDDFISLFILNFDYILLMIIAYKLYFSKGGFELCGMVVAGSSSLKKINLSNLLKRLQRNLHNFKALDKETKLTYIIYFILSLIWNTLTIIIILLVARLNDTIIECLFILTSFWLSKHAFGKPFHLSSMKQCFIVSNFTYYLLNRITTPLGISILIPIMLGVGLSYITSKLVKKTYKPLYKRMPKELFEETILKVIDKDSLEYKICYEYFVENKLALKVSNKYNYSVDGVKKIFKRINNKIKEL